MEIPSGQQVHNSALPLDRKFLQISCNWQITNNKQFNDIFIIISESKESERHTVSSLQDVISLDTCISLQSNESNNEACMLNIKLTNGQRISTIAVVSEAYILEFFKQSGEYERTISADFIDEFCDYSVYLAETAILPHTTEASIKFARIKNKTRNLWIYGIQLYLTEPSHEPKNFSTNIFSPEIIENFFTKLSINNERNNAANNVQESNNKEQAQSSSESTLSCNVGILTYVDEKCKDMEDKLMKRIEEMEQRTNQKLDTILKHLEVHYRIT